MIFIVWKGHVDLWFRCTVLLCFLVESYWNNAIPWTKMSFWTLNFNGMSLCWYSFDSSQKDLHFIFWHRCHVMDRLVGNSGKSSVCQLAPSLFYLCDCRDSFTVVRSLVSILFQKTLDRAFSELSNGVHFRFVRIKFKWVICILARPLQISKFLVDFPEMTGEWVLRLKQTQKMIDRAFKELSNGLFTRQFTVKMEKLTKN